VEVYVVCLFVCLYVCLSVLVFVCLVSMFNFFRIAEEIFRSDVLDVVGV
jgi:hypothetical protein